MNKPANGRSVGAVRIVLELEDDGRGWLGSWATRRGCNRFERMSENRFERRCSVTACLKSREETFDNAFEVSWSRVLSVILPDKSYDEAFEDTGRMGTVGGDIQVEVKGLLMRLRVNRRSVF